ncbi:MAG TPA: hypothetical protein VIK18_11410, partial [Pirellulales bacterium]
MRLLPWYNPEMETITFNVEALQPAVRQAIETVVGHALQPNQRLVIQVLEADAPAAPISNGSRGSKLPAWCKVLTDLTSDESAALDA